MKNRIATIVLLATLLLAACRPSPRPSRCPFAEGSVQIGILLSDSGEASTASLEQSRGYELALAEINAQGGVLGCNVEVVFGDDRSDPSRAAQAVQELAQESQAVLIVGAPSDRSTMSAAGVAAFYQTPFLTPAAGDERLTAQGNEWLFRLSPPASAYAAAALDAIEARSRRNAAVAIVYEDSLLGESGALPFASAAEARNMAIVAYESYPAGVLDATTVLTRVRQANADALYFVAQAQDALALLEQCDEPGSAPALVIGNVGGLANPTLLAAGECAEGVLLTVGWHHDWPTPLAAGFADNFRARYGSDPGASNARSYAALYVAVEAIRQADAGENVNWQDIQAARLAVRNALRALDLETAIGPIRFDSSGQNESAITVLQIVDSQYVTD